MLTDLVFLSDLPLYAYEKPYLLLGFPDIPEDERTNFQFTTQKQIYVENVRGREQDFSVLAHGFTFLKHTSNCFLRSDHFERATKNENVVSAYLEECVALLKNQIKGSEVVCIDWRVSMKI